MKRNDGTWIAAAVVAVATAAIVATPALGQAVLSGRIEGPRWPGSDQTLPYTTILCFASLDGPMRQSSGHRTFETHPVGWYYLPGDAGRYTLLCSTPAHYMRPILMTNLFTEHGQRVDRVIGPSFDYGVFDDSQWDNKPASRYYQTFTAKGTSITHVGFRFPTDGVDGEGPQSQNILLSIHAAAPGTPDTWKQVGPSATVLDVDCGGPKQYIYSAGWNSGEVPVEPGKTYAVQVRAEAPDGKVQSYWHADDDPTTDCYRIGEAGLQGWTRHDLWMAIGSDHDGLVIPYNKRVHKQFGEFAGGGRKWTQTYVARGRGLAGVILYAACDGTQPSMNRQRLVVRVREGGPDGPVIGVEKLATGNGQYTGDASWGTFGTVYSPGEVALTPGKAYALEFETFEGWETLHGHVDIKGRAANLTPGFNPYRKAAQDTYEQGSAYRNGTERVDFDLDLQVLEYEHARADWAMALHSKNLLVNGDMKDGHLGSPAEPAATATGWQTFAVDPSTLHQYVAEGQKQDNRVLRVIAGGPTGRTADGGFVQRVGGLSKLETYRLTGKLRSTWPVGESHRCCIGYDPTGQTDDPQAATIVWTILPTTSGWFAPYESGPVRPSSDSISVWLRAWTKQAEGFVFRADFDDFALRQVQTGVPGAVER